jgi:ABC-2 type transport system ATP-binding protein
MEHTPVAIEAHNLSKLYPNSAGRKFALKSISLQIPVGEIWCLLGPNGSGKTTLLKILAGLLTPTEGTYSIMGVDPSKDSREARTHIGWMPAEERSGFYGRLSGRENLTFFATLQRILPNDTGRLIGNLAFLLDCADDLDKMVLQTSAGARQKFGLARALLHNPSVLLLDEPLRNLDPHAVLRLRRLLKDHLTRRNKQTVLLSTHQLDEARRIADRILILRDGEILLSLEADEWESELKHKSVEEFYLKTIDAAPKT